jgi:DnaJ-class molecular chaperone
MNKKIFNPENYDMVICPFCDSHGYIQNPERECCPKCGGFGFIKKEAKENKNTKVVHFFRPIIFRGKYRESFG